MLTSLTNMKVVALLWLIVTAEAWTNGALPRAQTATTGATTPTTTDHHETSASAASAAASSHDTRRRELFVQKPVAVAASLLAFTAGTTAAPPPALALVKGNAPPPKTKVGADGGKPKCTNVEECQAQAERKAEEERLEAEANAVPVSTTGRGTRYRDITTGSGTEARAGNEVTTYYKVLKLGKRSYDGISGEGTVVFSRGYGLEDDERQPRDKSFVTLLGAYSNIDAFNDAVVGMKEGGVRRFAVAPDKGWRKPGKACDGGPGGSGQGGDLKTDYVVVPTGAWCVRVRVRVLASERALLVYQ